MFGSPDLEINIGRGWMRTLRVNSSISQSKKNLGGPKMDISFSYLLKAFVLTTAFAISLSIVFALVFFLLIEDREKRKLATKAAFVVLILAAFAATWGFGYFRFPLVDQLYDQLFSGKIFAASVTQPANINLNVHVSEENPAGVTSDVDTEQNSSEEENSSTEEAVEQSTTESEDEINEYHRLRGRGAYRYGDEDG